MLKTDTHPEFSFERSGDIGDSRTAMFESWMKYAKTMSFDEARKLAEQMADFDMNQFKLSGGEPYSVKMNQGDRERLQEMAPGLNVESLEASLEILDFNNLKQVDKVLSDALGAIFIGGLPALTTIMMATNIALHNYFESKGMPRSQIMEAAPAGSLGITVAMLVGLALGTDKYKQMVENMNQSALNRGANKINADLNAALRSEGIIK